MLIGVPPFYYENSEAIVIQLILENTLVFPKFVPLSSPVKDLILSLLKTDKSQRIGFNSLDDIRKHPWFDNFDWREHKRYPPSNRQDDQSMSILDAATRRVKSDYSPVEL